jgi:flagellar basal body-associated protein FliL
VPPKPKREEKKKKTNVTKLFLFLFLIAGVISLLFFVKPDKKPKFYWKSKSTSWGTGKEVSSKTNEIPLCENIAVENWVTQRQRVLITTSIYAKAEEEKKEQLKSLVNSNNGQIKDRIRSILAGLPTQNIRDPHLNEVKNQVQSSMDKIVGQGLINSILVPEWHCSRLR